MSGSTVLIADDEEAILDGLEAYLDAKGYKVFTASDGETALQKAVQEKPSVVVLDLEIPKLSGAEVCRRIKADQSTRGIKIIFATGRGREEVGEAALAAGADGYILKPFGGARLVEEVEKLLRQ